VIIDWGDKQTLLVLLTVFHICYIFVLDYEKLCQKSTHRLETFMKFAGTATALLILLFIGSFLNAGEIYTWMDDNGILTITDRPPPDGVQLQHITRYKKKPEKEQKETPRLNEETGQEPLQQQKVAAAQASRDQAAAARKEAEAAIHRAQEAKQDLLGYIEKYGTQKKKTKKHRSRIKALAETATAAKARADETIRRSNQAAEKSWDADKRAAETETQP
jgi:hypothetical protein